MRTGGISVPVLLAALLASAAGCAPTVWTKPGVDEATRDADIARCEAFAREQVEDDFVARIEDTQRGVTVGRDALYSRDDMRRYDERARRLSLIESCMRQLGYTEGEPDAATEETGGDAE
ncbi:MAG: hypothetical protein R3F55_15460 [Alphaproteobacteria bacterium]